MSVFPYPFSSIAPKRRNKTMKMCCILHTDIQFFFHTHKIKFMMKPVLVSHGDGVCVCVEIYIKWGAQTCCLFSIYETYCQIYMCFSIILLPYLYVLQIGFISPFQWECIHLILQQNPEINCLYVPNVIQM